ncbi:MAG TPA: RNA pseudouridine synthase [Erysipelothrix sp.]|nr:RNA pseudouridine synthase [Erysipelothrix sp.]
MKIYYEDNHLLVVKKSANQPVQEDSSGDLDSLNMAKNYIKTTYNKPGNVFLGLVHRLDRPVSGILVFAKTSKAASRLSNQIRLNSWRKNYLAVCVGKVEKGQVVDYLVKDHKTNTSYVTSKEKGKKSILEVIDVKYNKTQNLSLVSINLITGRSHQIRVQLANRGTPIWGDARYNRNAKPGQQIALFANELEIEHPTLKKRLVFSDLAPSVYPFTLW